MSFLPEEDRELLALKKIAFEEKEEKLPDGNVRRGVVFPAFTFQGNLHKREGNGTLVPCNQCDLLVIIPSQYATSKLDSFQTRPHLLRANGTDPDRATVTQNLFSQDWQFWSRHLSDEEWYKSGRDLVTYLQIVRDELRRA